ncbi:uncharacterized protein METZ01_LOCUS129355 [marine metagenome]|uniref:Uncharacterized protein n=1 Tax=marine metagenome TaxID=408172 RepID=A0A381YIY0_9ZZZZ
MPVYANQDLVAQPGEMEGWNSPHNRRGLSARSCFGEVGCLFFLRFSDTEVGVALAITISS